MNILTLANINSKKYGSFEKYLVDFSHFMKKKGHRHYILVIKEPVTPVKEKLIEAGAEIYIKYLDSLRLKNSIFLLDFIKKNKINVVHSHFYNLYNFFSFLIYFTKAKYFITYHISGEDEIRNSGFREKIKKIRQNIFGMGINKIFCVSNYNQKKILNGFQESKKKVELIYNGINLEDYENLEKTKRKNVDKIKIISIANLIPEKGIQYLIKAIPYVIKKNKNCEILIVGEGKYKQNLKKLVKYLNIEKYVKFLGLIRDVPQSLLNSDIAVIPSTWNEAFGYTVIEAMAAKLPVIATNVGAIPEIVLNNKTGFIIEPKNEKAIADTINKLIGDKRLRKRLGREGKKRVSKLFTIRKQCEKQLRCFMN